MKSIVQFFISRHLFGNLLTVLVLVAGMYAAWTIRKDLFPSVDFDINLVIAAMPGASSDQVEKLLLNPLEEALREVDGIKKIQSTAIDSQAVLTLILDPDSRDVAKTRDDIQRAVDGVEDYPTDALRPIVRSLETGQTPVIEVSILSDKISELELRTWAKRIAEELAFTPGVARIEKASWRKREEIIELDPKKLQSQRVDINQVIRALAGQNRQLPAGNLLLLDQREMAVKTDGEFRDLKDINQTVIRSNFEGFGIKVSDLGTVREGLEEPQLLYTTNGEKAFSLIVIKKASADVLDTVEAVQNKMKEIAPRLPDGVQYKFVNDFTQYLRSRVSTLSGNLAIGIVLVLAILALFLPFRVALVVAIGIPFAMLGGIIVLKAMGLSINLISLIGLIIVSGMLVDDAIVVVENIYRRTELGDDIQTAVLEGTTEMVPAVFASVLTTVAAFSPMLFMSGIFGKFVYEIPVMVIVPLLISLIEAFIIGPGHFFSWVKNVRTAPKVSSTQRTAADVSGGRRWYTAVLERYRGLITWTLDHRGLTMVVLALVLAVTGGAVTKMKFILFPPEGIYTFFIRIDGQPGASLAEMEKLVNQIEPVVMSLPKEELQDMITRIGIQQDEPNDPFTKQAPHYAQIQVNLTPEDKRSRSVAEVIEDMRARIQKPEGALDIKFDMAQGGPPQGNPIAISITGNDFDQLRKIGDQVRQVLSSIDGVIDIEDSEVVGKQEVRVIPRKEDLARTGISAADVATTLRASFAGIVATSKRNLDEEIDIRVKLKENPGPSGDQLANIEIGNLQGDLIPLSKVADFETGPSRIVIRHEQSKRVLTVGAQVDLEKITALEATAKAQELLKDLIAQNPEYRIVFGGENEDTEESLNSLFKAFAVAGMLIFVLLVLTFGSFVQPFLVSLAVPMGFVGVVWALVLHNKPLSFMALLGMIALAGVIVNNAIVLIDFFNTNRREGMTVRDALIDATTMRLRPILLTSGTTVLGLMPTAYGIGGSDGFVAALALALGWGLLIGSILTMIFLPAIISLTESLRISTASLFSRGSISGSKTPAG